MKLNTFFEMLDSDDFLRTDYIVRLKYKYDWEKDYTFSNEYLEYSGNDDSWLWLNDWNEGQTDVEVIGYVAIEDVNVQQTIEAEPVRHARWINDIFCSNCKRFPVDVSVSIPNRELTKYFSRCPHCGAKMDEQEEE